MAASPQGRGYGITKSDMEASRLVFVFVKDSKPRRKVAVPVPDHYTWEEFLNQVKHKLRLSSVGEIYLASSGQKIHNLDELQDIDELCVEEAAPLPPEISTPVMSSEAALRSTTSWQGQVVPSEAALRSAVTPSPSQDMSTANGPSTPTVYRQGSLGQDKHRVVMADGRGTPSNKADDPSGEDKYVKRSGYGRRLLQRLWPSLYQPGLPVSTRESTEDKGPGAARRTRRRRGALSGRNMLLILAVGSCLTTMVVLYLRVSATI